MTVEVDSIINYLKSTAVEFIVTDINTPGEHTKGGNHYLAGTPSASGWQGLAIDAAHKRGGAPNSAELLSIFSKMWDVKNQLQELYYSGPGVSYMVRNGITQIKTVIPKSIINTHHNHVHIAVRKGTFLQPVKRENELKIIDTQIEHNRLQVEVMVMEMPIIKKGDNGQYVKILQGLLIANGRAVSVDGDFGPVTETALREWQSAVSITNDGVCGPVTWRRLLCI